MGALFYSKYAALVHAFRPVHPGFDGELAPNVTSPTVEHCVPRSHYFDGDKTLGRDMHALICVPKGLDCKRSNFKLVDANFIDIPDSGIALRDDKRRHFVPPELYRGPYARSIGILC